MRIAKRAGLLLAAAVGGAVGGYLAVLVGLTALTLAWNVLGLLVGTESRDFISGGWLTFKGILCLLGALAGFVWSVRSETIEEGGSLAGLVIGLPALAVFAFFGLIYGSGSVGNAIFGSSGWGLVGGVALLLVGSVILGFISGGRHADQA